MTGTATTPFEFSTAFCRTLGLLTPAELQALRGKTVAIAGLGGVGGKHLLTLARLGVGGFQLADFDEFSLENFNRQTGADMTTIGRKKLDVMIERALRINPELRIQPFPEGLTTGNLDRFLQGVDVYVDGLDFFAFKIRAAVFESCRDKGIPATTAGPIGMGAALLNFLPGGLSFRDYFNWRETDSDEDLAVKFAVGLTPTLKQRSYLVDRSYLSAAEKRGPSIGMATDLCAGIVGAEVLKILLGRGPLTQAPVSLHFDAYLNRLFRKWIPFGNRHPLQRLKIFIAKRVLARQEADRRRAGRSK